MGRQGLLAALLGAAAACTSANPAYEATGEGQGTAAEGETTLVPPDTSSGTSTSTSTADDPESESSEPTGPDDTGETSTTGEPSPSPELCRADLYGINDNGELHLIDVDEGTTAPLPPRVELRSWAIATDSTGKLYIDQLEQPSAVMVLAPVTFEIQDMLMIPGKMLPMMARAGVDPEGMVWVGSHDTNRFFRLSPVDGTSTEYMPLGIGAGGDMVFLDPDRALVPSLQGDLSLVDFSQPREISVASVPVEGLMEGTLLTGIAHDPAGKLWLGVADGQLLRVGFTGRELDGAHVDETITLGVTLNDLATVVEPPGC
jgi:hypothetical protein